MSPKDTNNNGAATAAEAAEGATGGIPDADAKFLIACLQNTTGGNVTIDSFKVATLLGYKNHRSVNNRIAQMKKKYGLPIGCSSAKAGDENGGPSGSKNGDDDGSLPGPGDAKVPATPGKKRVTKPRATPGSKATPAKGQGKSKTKVEAKVEAKTEDASDDENGEEAGVKNEASDEADADIDEA